MLRIKSHLSFIFFHFLPFKLNNYRDSSIENYQSEVNLFFSTILLIAVHVGGEKKGTAFLLLSCYLPVKFLTIDTKVLLKIGSPTTFRLASN